MQQGMQFQKVKMKIRTSALLLTACLLAICFTVSAQEDDALLDELFWEGETIFTTSCVACHDADGGSSSAPALSGLPSMGARDHIVRQILYGNAERGMPPFAPTLDDRQVAAVATYIRNAWDNAHGIVTTEDVAKVRDAGPEGR